MAGKEQIAVGNKPKPVTSHPHARTGEDSEGTVPRTGECVVAARYYHEYHGHQIRDLEIVHQNLKDQGVNSFVFLCGDSSLDNKYWLFNRNYRLVAKKAVNGYEKILNPPLMVPDVDYWLNVLLAERNRGESDENRIACVNAAVEESALADRTRGILLQDRFIQRKIRENDYLIISLGGNDIVLKPQFATILNLGWMLIRYGAKSIESGNVTGIKHFKKLFGERVQKFAQELIKYHKPKRVIICMIYYPDQVGRGSWADTALGLMGYNKKPEKIQAAIRLMFREATSKIRLEGTEVVAFPLFRWLDSTRSDHYTQRVEPSSAGGRRMAEGLLQAILTGNADPEGKAVEEAHADAVNTSQYTKCNS